MPHKAEAEIVTNNEWTIDYTVYNFVATVCKPTTMACAITDEQMSNAEHGISKLRACSVRK